MSEQYQKAIDNLELMASKNIDVMTYRRIVIEVAKANPELFNEILAPINMSAVEVQSGATKVAGSKPDAESSDIIFGELEETCSELVTKMFNDGNSKVETIKALRAFSKMGLKTAKDFVERMYPRPESWAQIRHF